jgi:hypothetical protein
MLLFIILVINFITKTCYGAMVKDLNPPNEGEGLGSSPHLATYLLLKILT